MSKLEGAVERAAEVLPEEDAENLRLSVETLAYLQHELGKKNASIARLRSLLGMTSSEKSSKVLAKAKPGVGDDDTGDREASRRSAQKGKKKGHGRKSAAEYEAAEVVAVQHESLASGALCPECEDGVVYSMSKPQVLVRVTGQAPLTATRYELERLRCNLCGGIFAAAPPSEVGPEKYDAKAAAMIALLKYGTGTPFHRLAKLQGHLGIPLPTSTQWDIIEECAGNLVPVHDELIRQAAQGALLHNDDTSMKVLALRKAIEQKVDAGETKRTGIFTTGIISKLADGQQIALYFTGDQHAGENLQDLLAKRAVELARPLQMCDGLDHNQPKDFETILGNCLAHGRRKFVEVVRSFPDECRRVLETLGEVYKKDDEARERGMSDDERLQLHQKHSRPLMDELRAWMTEQFEEKLVEPNSSLGDAINYMTKRWDRLTLFLREPGAPLDNNIVERSLKKAVLHRKNALFYKTENGARVGDLFMGLIHSAELAGANPFDYLTALIDNADRAAEQPDRWSPWNFGEARPQSDGAIS